MAEELLDYSGREFSFAYADFVRSEQKIAFERDCEDIRDSARKVVADFCVLGKRLEHLKLSNAWRNVLDQNGERYGADNFTDFCFFAFGFSATKTSNMLGLAQFVLEDDGEWVLDEKYAGFSTSKLIEISSAYSFQRDYFLPTWTVKEIRLVKNYLKVHSCLGQTPDSLLKSALALEEKRAMAKQAAKTAEQETLSSVQTPDKKDNEPKLEDYDVHSFLVAFEPFDGYRKRVCQLLDQRMTSELMGDVLKKELNFGDFFLNPYVASWDKDGFLVRNRMYGLERLMTWQSFALEYAIAQTMGRFGTEGQREAWIDEDEESDGTDVAVSDVGNEESETDEETFDVVDAETVDENGEIVPPADEVADDERYDLTTRDGRREWLKDYPNWKVYDNPKHLCLCATSAYQYVVRALNLAVFVVERSVLNNAFEAIATGVSYYASIGEDGAFVDVQKDRLEKYIADGLKSL